jgi:hypothetical protein
MRSVEHVAYNGKKRRGIQDFEGQHRGKNNLEYIGVDWKITLKLILKK